MQDWEGRTAPGITSAFILLELSRPLAPRAAVDLPAPRRERREDTDVCPGVLHRAWRPAEGPQTFAHVGGVTPVFPVMTAGCRVGSYENK